MADQSKIQSIVQNLQGTHTQGQANVPSSAQTGNPNSVYNWTTYLPSVGNTNGRPTVNFDLLTAQAPASSPGYTPPFTADPYAAMVMASMPRASENPIIANLLSGYRGGSGQPPGGPGAGNPTTPPAGPGTGPGAGPGTGPGPSTPWSGAGPGRPIGPISGPIDRNPTDWRANYANAQSNTNPTESGYGRNSVFPTTQWSTGNRAPWAQSGLGTPNEQDGSNQVVQGIQNLLTRGLGWLGDQAQEFVQDLTLQNGWQGAAGQALEMLGIPGASMIIDQLFPGDMSPELIAQTNSRLAQQVQDMMSQALNGLTSDGRINPETTDKLNQQLQRLMAEAQSNSSGGKLPEGWTAEAWGNREFAGRQRVIDFANLFRQGGGSGKNPITGMPSGSLIENMQNASLAQTLDFVRRMQERRGNLQQ